MRSPQRRLAAPFLVVLASAFLAGSALSQNAPPAPPKVNDVMKRAEQKAAPAKEHALLQPLVGAWTVESRLWYQPDMPPLVANGTGTNAWILGDRFLKCDAKVGGDDTFHGESMTVYGFDTRAGKFTVYGIDTTGTYSVSAQGDYDAALKTFTLVGENEDEGVKLSFKWIVRIESNDRHSQEVQLKLPDIGWFKVAENIYTRAH